MKRKLSQSHPAIPLLDAIKERGGGEHSRYHDLVAEKIALPAEDRSNCITISGQSYNALKREVLRPGN